MDLWNGYLLLAKNIEVEQEVNARVHKLFTNWNMIRFEIANEKEMVEKESGSYSDPEKQSQLQEAANQFGSYVSQLIREALG